MRPWAVAALALALAAPVATRLACAQALPADADKDGVMDDVDACPDSPPYDMVGADGCSVCDCELDGDGVAWTSRAAYLRCILAEVHARRADGRLTRKTERPVLKAAHMSTCGFANEVRCCVMLPTTSGGMCRIMDELRCDESVLGAGSVEDLDAGSCFPNPCVP